MTGLTKEAQVRLWIRHKITEGVWKPGEKLPSLTEISQETGTSFSTVRNAIEELQHHGVILGQQGRGNFLSALAVGSYWNRFNHFRGKNGELVRFFPQCLSFKEESADKDTAAMLSLKAGTPVIHLWRSHCDITTKKPLHLDEIILVRQYFKNLTLKMLTQDYVHTSIYSVYEQTCGIVIGSTSNTMSAVVYRRGLLPYDIFEEGSAVLVQQPRV